MVTMGNLFSGSGTWELAAQICGMEVKFEAEIEKFPVAVEAKRFPNAIQLGDVSKIDGHDIPIVDFICNSSPCQDLSVAGKRAGLAGERSGLFDQAIRITKEMREHDEQLKRVTGADVPRGLIRPRIFGWENVPGALSSGAEKGADFREVLSSIVGIVEEKHSDIPIPRGGWHNAGLLDGDGWQVAWRILDAQYVGGGTAQRRRRLFVIADFGGHRAGEILFKPASVPWNYSAVMQAWKDTSRSLDKRIAEASRTIRCGAGSDENGSVTLSRSLYFENHPTDSRVTGPYSIAKTVAARYGTGGNNVPIILQRGTAAKNINGGVKHGKHQKRHT